MLIPGVIVLENDHAILGVQPDNQEFIKISMKTLFVLSQENVVLLSWKWRNNE